MFPHPRTAGAGGGTGGGGAGGGGGGGGGGEFSLCLSRACLGKMISFSMKLASQKDAFPYRGGADGGERPAERLQLQLLTRCLLLRLGVLRGVFGSRSVTGIALVDCFIAALVLVLLLLLLRLGLLPSGGGEARHCSGLQENDAF
eukprot:COSAG06_NODE_7801_length_2369_cov_9.942731_1_plen_145_part_10